MWFIVLFFRIGKLPAFRVSLDPTTGQIATYSTKAACDAAVTEWKFSARRLTQRHHPSVGCRTNQSRPNPCPPNGLVCTCCFLPPFPEQHQ